MKFRVEQKGAQFLVVNDTTGYVKGRHRTKGEAEVQAQHLQQTHDQAVEHASARLTPPKMDEQIPEEGE